MRAASTIAAPSERSSKATMKTPTLQRARSCPSQAAARPHAAASPMAGAPSLGNQALQRALLERGVQAKLALSVPGDRLEREADRVADDVLRMPDSAAAARIEHRAGGEVQRKCAACQGAIPAGKSPSSVAKTDSDGTFRWNTSWALSS